MSEQRFAGVEFPSVSPEAVKRAAALHARLLAHQGPFSYVGGMVNPEILDHTPHHVDAPITIETREFLQHSGILPKVRWRTSTDDLLAVRLDLPNATLNEALAYAAATVNQDMFDEGHLAGHLENGTLITAIGRIAGTV